MTTPRRHIRDLLREHVDTGAPLDGAVQYVTDAILDNPDLLGEIVAASVREEAGRMTSGHTPFRKSPAALREAIEEDAAASPFSSLPIPAPRKRNIFLDVANMTKLEVLNLASELDGEASKAARHSGLLRSVASQLTDTERVRDRFRIEDLQAIYAKSSVTVETRFFLGDRQVSRKEIAG